MKVLETTTNDFKKIRHILINKKQNKLNRHSKKQACK